MKDPKAKATNHDTVQNENRLINWSGNITYRSDKIYYPKSVPEVQEYIRKQKNIKVLGTRHCFNRIADSANGFIGTRDLNRIVQLDHINHTVTVEAGIKYGELAPFLFEHGYALHNLASLPHISVAGSIATATHGSGINNKNLAGAVAEIEMVIADGSLVSLNKNEEGAHFYASVVGLGAIGLVTKVKLQLEKAFQVRQYVFTDLPLSQLNENFNKIISAAYSVSLFTDWQSPFINEVWIKTRNEDHLQFTGSESFFDAVPAQKNLHPIKGLSAENCTEQMGVTGPWHERLPHFKMGFMPSAGNELQSEYFIPINNAVEGLSIIERLADLIAPYLYVSEIRTVAADEFWVSPCYRQSMAAFHFTWKNDWVAVSKILPVIEKELIPLGARPHWGKLFSMAAEAIAPCYERWHDFKNMVSFYDPEKKFRNEFLNQYIYGFDD